MEAAAASYQWRLLLLVLPLQHLLLSCCCATGHTQPLRTLVDVAIAQQTPQQLLCGGGGQVGKQLLLTVDQLLTATAGEVGLFSTQTQQQHQQTQQQQAQAQLQRQQTQRQQQTQAMDAAAFQHLPEPWSAGAEQVTLVGVLAQRRRYKLAWGHPSTTH